MEFIILHVNGVGKVLPSLPAVYWVFIDKKIRTLLFAHTLPFPASKGPAVWSCTSCFNGANLPQWEKRLLPPSYSPDHYLCQIDPRWAGSIKDLPLQGTSSAQLQLLLWGSCQSIPTLSERFLLFGLENTLIVFISWLSWNCTALSDDSYSNLFPVPEFYWQEIQKD